MRAGVALAAALMLAACASPPATYRDLDRLGEEYQRQPQNAEQATEQDTCGAARFRNLIGAQAGEIDESTLPPRTRIITPDMMVTQDFSAQRLNIMVGTNGRVGSMRCF